MSSLIAVLVLISACAGANAIPEPGGSNNSTSRMIEYAFVSKMVDGKIAFIGNGGSIDRAINPTLSASIGDTLRVTWRVAKAWGHNISFPDFNAMSEGVAGEGSSTTLEFTVDKAGSFTYIVSIPSHKEAGMLGRLEATGSIAGNSDPATPPVNNNSWAGVPVIAYNHVTRGADRENLNVAGFFAENLFDLQK